MRKGFTLVEILVVIAVLAAALVALAPVFRTLISDIPRSYRVSQANTSMADMLEQMGRDIDAAKRLPESFGGLARDDRTLLIELTDGVICYQLEEDKVVRRMATDGRQGEGEDATVWLAPKGRIAWQVWQKEGKDYAVEVQSHIDYAAGGRIEKRMANSHVYFLGVFREVSR
ncbi:MAG TPA: prepilin-type N-terminal cleavage/methylation domain-containing protein [Sedimentisphaerales bacterium]|nr:prepilin-type N-terminal cleavage/methylation domain-containing protein [Sedimentisphaerales bacterium]